MEQLLAQAAWLVVVYLLGSIPFGLVVTRLVKGVDPRNHGSQNTGATNVARICGARYGALTLLLDLLKGLAPVLVAYYISPSAFFLSLTGLAALLGHMHSVFLYGRGGKGVATTIGIFLALTPGPLFLSLVLCFLLIYLVGYVSLGSMALVASLPLFILLSANFEFLALSLVVLVLVFAKHRDNIVRLARGEEKSWRRGEQSAS